MAGTSKPVNPTPEVQHRLRAEQKFLVYQGTLIEIPMNFELLPDGSGRNPMYDPEYLYGWGAYKSASDIPLKMAKGWRLVEPEELDSKLPGNYRHALRVEGSYLVFGDLVLLKIHRADHAANLKQEEEYALAHLKSAGRDSLENIPTIVPQDRKNEVILRAE